MHRRHRFVVACAAFALAGMAACSSSSSSFAACGYSSSIAGPGSRPSFHTIITHDSTWPARLEADVAAAPSDSLIRVLLIHETDIGTADREYVTSRGGTILDEPADWNGIVAAFTVAELRTFVDGVPLNRIIDAHLVTENVLPPCE